MAKPLAEGPAQLKKPNFFGFVAGKLSRQDLWLTLWERKAWHLCRQVEWQSIRSSDGQTKLGANVPARGAAKRAN